MSAIVYLTSTTLPNYPFPLVYKELLPKAGLSQWASDMERAVSWRNSLGDADRAALDRIAVWPLELVTSGGNIVGCLMPRIPDEYFATQNDVGGGTRSQPRTIDYLVATPTALQRLGLDREAVEWDELFRLAMAAHLVYSIAFLHRHGLVYGDVSLKNAVFSTTPPGVLLLDCDATAGLANARRSQANSPGYAAPEMEPLGANPFARGKPSWQDHQTDVFKLGVTLLKVLHGGDGAAQRTSPDEIANLVPPTTYGAVKRTLDINPMARGSARDLYSVLVDDLTRSMLAPQIDSFIAFPEILPRGTDVELSWQVDGATGITILGPNGFSIAVPAAVNRWTITPRHSGSFTLVATNRGGSTQATSAHVDLFDLPGFRLDLPGFAKVVLPQDIPSLPVGRVPMPNVSPLNASVAKVTAGIPDVRVPDLVELNRLYRVTDSIAGLVASTRPAVLDGYTNATPRAMLNAAIGEATSLLDREIGDISRLMDDSHARLASIAQDEVTLAEHRIRAAVQAAAALNQAP